MSRDQLRASQPEACAYRSAMTKHKPAIRNPDQDADASTFDVTRMVIGGETPAELLARIEDEQRRLPLRILDGIRSGRKPKP